MPEENTIVLSFFNLGGYHLARLRSVQAALPGWKVDVIEFTGIDTERPWGSDLDQSGIAVHRLFDSVAALESTSNTALKRRIEQVLESLDPTVVVVPGWGHATARFMRRWARRRNLPAILMSESKWDDKPRNWLAEIFKWFIVRNYDAAIVGGKKHRDYLERLGLRREQVFFGYDVVDNDFFRETATSARNDPARLLEEYGLQQPFFIVSSRFIERKNLAGLIRAYQHYAQQCEQPYMLAIFGGGEIEGALRQNVTDLGLSKLVVMPGFVEYRRMAELFGLAAALVHPAMVEQWGLVVNEACAAGLPVLLSETVGASEIFADGEGGILFDPGSQQAMTDALLAFHNLGEQEQTAMGEAAARAIASYAPAAFGRGIADALSYISEHRTVSYAPVRSSS